MLRDAEEDISLNKKEFLNIALFSEGLRIVIIGAGKSALIKVKTLLKGNAYIEIVSKDFSKEIVELKNEKLKLIKSDYNKKFIEDKHLVFICLSDDKVIEEIKRDCEKVKKIYLNGKSSKDGCFVMQSTVETKALNIALNTKGGNPKGAKFACDRIEKVSLEIDSFIEYTTRIRNSIKNNKDREKILNFINSDDFNFIFKKEKGTLVLSMFFEDIFKD